MSEKLLLVDDSPVVLSAITAILKEALECELFTAATGTEALEVARREQPDVILLDVTLPDMDGFSVVEHLKSDENLSGIYIIFLTGTMLQPEDKVRGLNLGAYDYLIKPADPKELVARVQVGFRLKRAEKVLLEGVNLAFRTFRHELFNPLQALLMTLELLERQTNDLDDKLKTRLSRVREAAEKIHTILQSSQEITNVQTTTSPDGEIILRTS
jgi:DNA-binding response OmpR family regulator